MIALSTVKEVSDKFKAELKGFYPVEEIRNFVWIIFEHVLGFSKVDLITKDDQVLNEEQQLFCEEVLLQLKQHKPIQQIIGNTEFYGLTFQVNEHVLIPRPETEELVQWIIEDNKLTKPNILDIGTGSGCIPICLKKNIAEAEVSAWDISEEALNVAKQNAVLNDTKVNFKLQDVLKSDIESSLQLDVVVSNPPYIRELEKDLMQDNVLEFEPHLALFVSDQDPLIFYRKISQLATKLLKNGGLLYFEINEGLGQETWDLMISLGFKNIELRKDLFGKDRMVKGQWLV